MDTLEVLVWSDGEWAECSDEQAMIKSKGENFVRCHIPLSGLAELEGAATTTEDPVDKWVSAHISELF